MAAAEIDREVLAALGELEDSSPAEFPEILQGIAGLFGRTVGTADVLVCFAANDSMSGRAAEWSLPAAKRIGPNRDHDEAILDQWYRSRKHVETDPAVQALARTCGHPRALLRSDVASDAVWRRSGVDALLAESGIGDRLVAAVPLVPGVEMLLVTYRRVRERGFGAEDRDRALQLVSRLPKVGTTIARAYGLIDSRAALGRRERSVLRLLLLGYSEAEAASRLGLTTRSLHQYVVEIHRKLGVHSRGELIAHFLTPARREALLTRFSSLLGTREMGVLRGLARGLSEKEIADHLSLTGRAVHHAIGSIYGKLGTHTRAALMGRVLAEARDVAPELQH